MKLFPNKEDVTLYVRTMGKCLRVTAIFDSTDEANAHMEKHDEQACVAVSGSLVLLADRHDRGIKVLA